MFVQVGSVEFPLRDFQPALKRRLVFGPATTQSPFQFLETTRMDKDGNRIWKSFDDLSGSFDVDFQDYPFSGLKSAKNSLF